MAGSLKAGVSSPTGVRIENKMSAECHTCGHDLSPEGIGIAPCYFCEMRNALESADKFLNDMSSWKSFMGTLNETRETVRNALRRNE